MSATSIRPKTGLSLLPFQTKLCGNRSPSDVKASLAAGADALGFICGTTHYSEDALSPDNAAQLILLLPDEVTPVLVSHLSNIDELLALAQAVGARAIQAHGELTFNERETLYSHSRDHALQIIQVVHVGDASAILEAEAVAEIADALLLDSRSYDRLGGTGKTHDWQISRAIVKAVTCPVILAGGLKPGNVGVAIAAVQPAAVDANSGVDDITGAVEQRRADAFVREAHAAFRRCSPALLVQ